jgi:hypothetical protein
VDQCSMNQMFCNGGMILTVHVVAC